MELLAGEFGSFRAVGKARRTLETRSRSCKAAKGSGNAM